MTKNHDALCHYESASYIGEELDGVCVCRPLREARAEERVLLDEDVKRALAVVSSAMRYGYEDGVGDARELVMAAVPFRGATAIIDGLDALKVKP